MTELDRLQILTRIAERRLTRRRAAELAPPQRAPGAEAVSGVRTGRRGRGDLPAARAAQQPAPGRRHAHALALVREHYADFGPTFAHQKLTEAHGLTLSVETLRGWLIAAGLTTFTRHHAHRCYLHRRRPPDCPAAAWSRSVEVYETCSRVQTRGHSPGAHTAPGPIHRSGHSTRSTYPRRRRPSTSCFQGTAQVHIRRWRQRNEIGRAAVPSTGADLTDGPTPRAAGPGA